MKKQNYFILVILISIFYFTFGCGGPKASSEASTAPPQVVAEVPFVGTFYLATYMGKSATTYITHKLIGGLNVDSDWTQSCTVPRSDLSTPAADIQCIAEAHELDIWAQGVTLAASFPAGFCDYVEEAPYFYFKYLPGVGPAAPPYSVAEPTCLYDYTKQEGPNCCSGEWTMPAGPSPATQPSRSGKYGGKFSNCYSGSGIKDFIASNSGVPGIKIYQNTNGNLVNLSKLS